MNTKLSKSDNLILILYFSIASIIQVNDYYKGNNDLIEYLLDIPAYVVFSVCVIFCFLFWLIPNYIINQKKYVLFIILALIILAFFGGSLIIIEYWTGGHDWAKFPEPIHFITESINDCAIDISLPFGLLLGKKFYEGQTQFLKIEKEQKENELKLLRSQIDPHFLFNNLNTLDALIDSDSEKAKEYINRLSLIYRYLIKTKDAEIMELFEELNLAENYMFLINTRFGNDYSFEILKNTSINEKFIPTGALQILLENIVKHNKPQYGTSIKTKIYVENDFLKVENSKSVIISKNESFGTGLKNLKMRYNLLSNKEIIITNTNDTYTISIPIIKLVD